MKPLRIGIDATSWANGRGYGRFLRQLLPELVRLAPPDEITCFLDPASRGDFPVNLGVRVVEVPVHEAPTRAASASGHRSPLDLLRMRRAVRRVALDVFFMPTVYTWFPLPRGLPAVVTIHDAIAERFPQLTLPHWRARLFWNWKVRLALAQATRVLTVSEFAAGDLVRVLGVRRNRLRVAPEAPAPGFVPSTPEAASHAALRHGLPANARWLIYVGGFNPHKRLDTLLDAYGMLVDHVGRPDAPHLVLVGAIDRDVFHEHREVLTSWIAQRGIGDLVHWTGFVPDPELRHLYSGAIACVLPSEVEGFGLPVVEAAACGTPGIATTESPLPQLLGEGGLWVRPGETTTLFEALLSLTSDPDRQRRMGRVALAQSGLLSWEQTAVATLDTLRETVEA